MKRLAGLGFAIAGLFLSSAAPVPASYSVLIRGGTIYDGSGAAPYVGDVALQGDKIVLSGARRPDARRGPSTRPERLCRRASSTC